MPDRTCAVCGAPVMGRRRRFCSDSCKNARKRTTPNAVCEVCLKPYVNRGGTKTRACSRACGWFITPHPRRSTDLRWKQCHCGQWWIANQGGSHCAPPPPPPPRCPLVVADCAWCAHAFVKTGLKRYCSHRCRDLCHPQRRKSSPISYGECVVCGEPFVRRASRGQRATCSGRCAKRVRRRRERKRLRDAPNRETYTLRQVAERDGWRCHICGKRVPDREYRARPLDPTIDHLVPVSAGGDDTMVNVALAHNQCNWQRADRGNAQLRLIA